MVAYLKPGALRMPKTDIEERFSIIVFNVQCRREIA